MKKILKRTLSIIMVLFLFLTILPNMNNSSAEAVSSGLSISQLRQKFPHGKYWNHAGNPGASNSVNNQNGYTSTPCTLHGGYIGTSKQTCNGFQPSGSQLSWQCMGYAEKLGYDATGYNPRNNANGWYTYTSSSALNNLKPGDIVRYKNDGHSIYVIAVNGDTVTYTDCNNDGHCIIRWDATISKSTLKSTFTHVRSAPSSPKPDECNCSTSYAGNYICSTSSLNLTIRSGHGSSYSAIGSIPPGATVTVSKASGSNNSAWAHVTYNGVSGYASMEYLRKEETHSCSGYEISLTNSSSNGKFYDSNIAQITIIPKVDGKNASESEINQITLKIKAPDGSVKTNNMGKSTTYKFYIGDGVKNAGTYTFWAEVDTKYGSYKGSANNGSTSLTLSTVSLTNGTFDGDITYKRIQFEEIDRYLTVDSDGNVVSYERQHNNSSNQSQVWKLIKNSDGTYIIQSVENNNVLDVTKGVYAQGVNVITYNSQGSDNQKWYLSKNSDGDWFIRAAMSNSAVLDVEGGATANGTNVALWTYHGGTPQKVSFKYPYQITYNANGGSGAPANQSKDYNESVTLSSTKPTRSGYTFLGWSTSSSATSANYTPGSSYNSNADLNLYAVWKQASSIYTGTSYSTTIGFANQEHYYTFTPSVCGEYTFESTGGLDSRVYVYDSSWTQLGYNDDDGADYNFKLKINLTSGTKYYIKVRAYSSKVGSTSFKVTKSNETVGHSYTSTVTKTATCTETGTKKYTCSKCSYFYTATIASTGHSWNAASCTTPKTCSVCNTTSGSSLGHTYTNACDKTCNVCSATRTVTHSYTTTTAKATLSKNGSIKTACTVCGNVKSETAISSPKTFTLSTTSYTYNGYVKTPTVTVKDAAGKVLTKGTDYTVTYAEGRKNVGTYKVTVKMTGNYTGTKTLTFKINPIDISTCTVKLSATSLTYNGKVRTPTVTVTNANGAKLTKDTHYTVTYSSGRKNVGTYNVTVKMQGNYTGTKTLSFKIKPMDISKCTVKLSATSLTYNGKVRTPTVTVTNANGAKLTKDTHYTVTYASGRKNVGTYKVTVKLLGNYTGTKTLTFKINPIKISTCTVKLSATSLTYNGEIRTPEVSVTNAYGTTLAQDKHYTVSYSTGRKTVGTYKVTVKMIGNYTGTKTLTFKITPPKTTVVSLTAGTKSITVNLTKKTTQVTGYQIQYSTNKDFTNAKTKTITSNSTVKTTLSSLSAAKTYYVRVRTYKTVNDVKYYSGWSAYKYVKTK